MGLEQPEDEVETETVASQSDSLADTEAALHVEGKSLDDHKPSLADRLAAKLDKRASGSD